MRTTIRHLLELIRFSHTLFALPFALLAAVMAWHKSAMIGYFPRSDGTISHDSPFGSFVISWPRKYPDLGSIQMGSEFSWKQLAAILCCMIAARSFAMAFNRLADRQLDANNPRTIGRHLPSGILSVAEVAIFTIACAAAFVISTLLFLPNRLPLYCSIPVLVFLAGYSFAKRFTALAHFWLGAGLALSPVAVWIAVRGDVVMQHIADLKPALVLGGAVLSWVAGFDIIYACQDFEFDRRAELHSVPVQLGISGALRLAAACHALTVVFLVYLPATYPFGWIYWTGIAAVGVLLVYEHLLVRPNDLSHVNAAFFNVNAVISLGLFAVGSLDLWIRGG